MHRPLPGAALEPALDPALHRPAAQRHPAAAPSAAHGAMAQRLDALASWRAAVGAAAADLARDLEAHDLLSDADRSLLATLHERLASDALVLAFVAEVSRGKSELINAIFFADAGRRVLPATPGRTTMSPVELWHDPEHGPCLRLLPIETRLEGRSLAEWRRQPDRWQHVPLDMADPPALARALSAVTHTQRVSVAQAEALGLWHPEHPDDNPPLAADGSVEVPVWRHARISVPHPLLQRGLVVIDTPGLNAVGAEPELTLGLLPSAHAVVFVLAADSGVTKSDLALWREHLDTAGLERFVVLNKIDTLADPLLAEAEVQAQIERQRQEAAALLQVPLARVFALSARDALAARLTGHAAALQLSRLPQLEAALVDELLPRRQALLVAAAEAVLRQLQATAQQRLADRRRQQAEQVLELRGLRGKGGAKLRLLVERVDVEQADFERCTGRLAALRAVQQRMLKAALAPLSSEALRTEMAAMQAATGALPFSLGVRGAFETLMSRLRTALDSAATQADEMRQMLEASQQQLNAEFGFALVLPAAPSMAPFVSELQRIGQAYGRYLGVGQIWRMAAPGFAEQFRRMLHSKLRVVFENAAGEIELWSKAAGSQAEVQLRERRRAYTRRREALQRVQAATGELEQRITEVQDQGEALNTLQQRLQTQLAQVLAQVLALAQAPERPALRQSAA